jgi:hypothetical protein
MKMSKIKFRVIAKLPMKELKAASMMCGCFAGELMSCSMFQGCSAVCRFDGQTVATCFFAIFLKISEKLGWKRF